MEIKTRKSFHSYLTINENANSSCYRYDSYEKRLARYLIRLRKYTNLLKPTNGNSKTLKNKGVKIEVSFLNLNYEQTLHFDEVRRASREKIKVLCEQIRELTHDFLDYV